MYTIGEKNVVSIDHKINIKGCHLPRGWHQNNEGKILDESLQN